MKKNSEMFDDYRQILPNETEKDGSEKLRELSISKN